ncbi:MAG TPA: RNA methyltransferase [Terriglobales bacterium]|nr:RNA methyltransferase [Terriglobales bacterium]
MPRLSIAHRLRPISSAQNPLVKDMRKAFTRSELIVDHCAIEGFKLIEEAIRSGLKVRTVIFSESGAKRADRLLPQLKSQTETAVIPDTVFAGMVETETPQGVAALVSVREHTLEFLLSKPDPFLIVTAGLQDPGNLGTLIRCAEAFGVHGLLLGEGTVSRFNAKAMRASAGSTFRVPSLNVRLMEVFPVLKTKGVRFLATSSHKGEPINKADLTGAVAIIIGNEGAGVSREVLSHMDALVTIPQSENVESLNAGVAAGIILYEAWQQRSR